MTNTIKKNIELLNEKNITVFWSTVSVLSILTVAYFVLVFSVFSIGIAREEINNKTEAMSTEIEQMEFTYISAQNAITPDSAQNKGFLAVKDVQYLSRVPQITSLTLR